MGNPFDSISTKGSQSVGASGGQRTQLNIERFVKSYASIYDEYNSASAELRAINTDAKAELTKEVEATQKRLKSEMKKAALKSFLTSAATQLPALATSLTSLLGTAKTIKAGDTSASTTKTVEQMQQELTTAKEQVSAYDQAIKSATAEKTTAEETITEQARVSTEQQKLKDQADTDIATENTNIQKAKDDITKAEGYIATATTNLNEAQNRVITDDPTGALQRQKTQDINNATAELKRAEQAKADAEQAKKQAETKKEQAEARRKEAIENKNKADNLKAEAEAKKKEAQTTITTLTPKRDKLKTEITQLESEIARIQGSKTTKAEPSTK